MNGLTCGIKRVAAMALMAILLLTHAAPALAETFSAIVSSGSAAVYSDAKLANKAGTLKKKAVVRVTGYANGVARISYNGRRGYAKVSSLKAVDDVAKKVLTSRATRIYRSADTKSKSVAVKKGLRLYLLDAAKGWAMVERDGKVGYMNVKHLTEVGDDWKPKAAKQTTAEKAAAKPAVTVKRYTAKATESVKVYASASGKAKALGTLKKGQTVQVGAYNSDGWAYIRLNGKYGYCKLSALEKVTAKQTAARQTTEEAAAKPTVTVKRYTAKATESVKVYASASGKAKALGTLKKGQTVQVGAYNSDGWAYIRLNGKYGYCKRDALEKVTAAAAAKPSTKNAVKAIVATGMPVYKAAKTSSKKLGTLKKGQTVNVLKVSGSWAYIELNGSYGYTGVKGLKKPGATSDTAKKVSTKDAVKAKVAVASLPVYKSASTSSGKLGTLKKGQTVNLIKARGGWAYIELNGKYGFTSAKALKKASSQQSSGDSGGSAGVVPGDVDVPISKNTYATEVPGPLVSTIGSFDSGLSNAQKLEYVINVAQKQLGKPYVYGATGPSKYDCSGLTTYIFRQIGVSLPRSAYAQGYDNSYPKISAIGDLRRGDLVFFNTVSDSDLSDHVGIYLGSGYFLHASSGGHKVVVSNLRVGYYNRVYSWGRRVLK